MKTQSKAQRSIERYLRGIRNRLRNLEPAERDEILAGLRGHIQEELARRGTTHPTREDVAAVLAHMETPESFGQEARAAMRYTSRDRTLGPLALIALLSGVGVFLLGLLLGNLVAEFWLTAAILLTLVLCASALVLGIMSWRHPYGKGAAVTAILILIIASFLFPAGRTSTQTGSHEPIIEQRTTGSSP